MVISKNIICIYKYVICLKIIVLVGFIGIKVHNN